MTSYLSLSGTYAVVSCVNDSIAKEIFDFTALPEKWCYGRGKPATTLAALSATTMLANVRALGYGRIESFPDPDGSVLLTTFCANSPVEIRCDYSGAVSMTIENDDPEDSVIECSTFADAVGYLKGATCQPKSALSGYFIRGSTVSKTEDIQASHSKTMTVASQLSTVTVSVDHQRQFVSTSPDSIQMSAGRHQFFGESALANSRHTQLLTR